MAPRRNKRKQTGGTAAAVSARSTATTTSPKKSKAKKPRRRSPPAAAPRTKKSSSSSSLLLNDPRLLPCAKHAIGAQPESLHDFLVATTLHFLHRSERIHVHRKAILRLDQQNNPSSSSLAPAVATSLSSPAVATSSSTNLSMSLLDVIPVDDDVDEFQQQHDHPLLLVCNTTTTIPTHHHRHPSAAVATTTMVQQPQSQQQQQLRILQRQQHLRHKVSLLIEDRLHWFVAKMQVIAHGLFRANYYEPTTTDHTRHYQPHHDRGGAAPATVSSTNHHTWDWDELAAETLHQYYRDLHPTVGLVAYLETTKEHLVELHHHYHCHHRRRWQQQEQRQTTTTLLKVAKDEGTEKEKMMMKIEPPISIASRACTAPILPDFILSSCSSTLPAPAGAERFKSSSSSRQHSCSTINKNETKLWALDETSKQAVVDMVQAVSTELASLTRAMFVETSHHQSSTVKVGKVAITTTQQQQRKLVLNQQLAPQHPTSNKALSALRWRTRPPPHSSPRPFLVSSSNENFIAKDKPTRKRRRPLNNTTNNNMTRNAITSSLSSEQHFTCLQPRLDKKQRAL